MNPQLLKALLTKYQNGEATDEERKQVEAWYDALDDETEPDLSAADKQAFIEHHWQQLASQITPAPEVRRLPTSFYRAAVAAVVLLSLGLGWYFLLNRSAGDRLDLVAHQTTEAPSINQTNKSVRPLRLTLSDGSTITLQPGSDVQYPAVFAQDRREVRLVGEAFFEVTKNPERPFLVYANGMVTRVLGTSFTVIAHAGKPTAEVVVRTGRVAVYRQADKPASALNFVLKPNEKATFFKADSRLVKTLADHPVVLRPEVIKTHFLYEDTPVADVFRELDDAYGVHISFDKQALINCTLTANLANQSLPDQLNMICLSIGARYQTQGTQIRISGQGCP